MRSVSVYADYVKAKMELHSYPILFILSFLVAAVRGLNITRCLGPYNDSYKCPRQSDPPERTQCCLWNNQPACCLPGGSSCSDSADKRSYCPRPVDDHERTQCCVWDSKPTCCLPGGSSCEDSADKRNYCPGPDDGNERTHCCVWDSQPACCLPGGSSCDKTHFRDYCPGPNDEENDWVCCGDYAKKCCRKWSTTDWVIFGVILFVVVAVFMAGWCYKCTRPA